MIPFWPIPTFAAVTRRGVALRNEEERVTKSKTKPISARALYAIKLRGVAEYQAGGETWWFYRRDLGDGRTLWLQSMLAGNLRISTGPTGGMSFDQNWCFHDHDAAWRAAVGWNGHGDPEGWYKHINTGRRRPNGDPAKEYVAW